MKKSSKIFKSVFTFICLACIIISCVFAERLNAYFSTFSPFVSEGEAIIDNFNEDHVDFELKSGETLLLPVTFEKRLARIGIYLGEQTNSSDEYVFQLEDKYGMILGKAVKSLSEIKANDFVYLTSKAIISTDATYYIKIFSENENAAPLHITASFAESFQTAPFSVGGNESDKTLILDRRYQVSKNIVAVIDIALVLIIAAVWILGSEFIINNIKKIFDKCLKTIPWKKVTIATIAILVIANIVLLFLPEKQNMIQYGNSKSLKSSEQAVSLNEGVTLEQHIQQCEGKINNVSVLFATYTQKIKGETVYFELVDDTNQNIIYSESIASEKIHDNEYKDFLLPQPVDLNDKKLCVRLRSNGASENDTHIAVYLNDNLSPNMYMQKNGETLNYNLVFNFTNQVNVYRLKVSIILNGILFIVLMLYVWNFVRFKHTIIRSVICSCLLSVFMLPPVLSVLNYRTLSMDGMAASLWNRSDLSPNRDYDEKTLIDSLTVEKNYGYDGKLSSIYERTEVPVKGIISNITLNFLGDTVEWKRYEIQLYWDTGAGFNEKQLYTYQYVHQGQDSISFSVPCNELVQRMMINIGQNSVRAYELSSHIIPLTHIEVNKHLSPNIFSYRTLLVFLCLNIFSIIVFLWKYFEFDKRIEKVFIGKKISISFVFVIIASIYGLCFSFMMPTLQTPDEGEHIKMLYTDIGNPDMRNSIYGCLGEQGMKGVTNNSGQTIDIGSYFESSKNRLNDYNFNYKSPSIKMLRRPGQVFGVLIGQLLHLPAYWILQLGEIGALAVYIILGAVTLKIIPYKKNLMMLVMLLPIAIQEAGSFAYDSFTNAVSYLTIAYILYLKVKAEKVSWKQFATLAALAVCLLLGKVVYVLLLFLVFIIPLDKLELKIGKFKLNKEWINNHKIITVISLAVFLCTAAFGSLIFLRLFGYGDISQMLIGYLNSFSQMIRLFATSAYIHLKEWLRGIITYFGWYDNPPNDLFMCFVIISTFIFALMHHKKFSENDIQTNINENACLFSRANLILWYGVFVILFFVVQMTMIGWGFFIYGIDSDLPYSVSMRLLPRIEGVNGRYFLPIIPLLFIPLHTKKDILGFIPKWLYKICYYLIVIIFPISMLLLRYWGVGSW